MSTIRKTVKHVPKGSYEVRKKAGISRRALISVARDRYPMGAPSRSPDTELKFFDVDVDDASIAQNGTIVADTICTILQNVTESGRIGRKAVVKRINWRYNIQLSGTTGAAAQGSEVVRVIMYLDRQCNGAAATVTAILEDGNYQSYNQLVNKDRFTILHDKLFYVNGTSGAGDGTSNDFPGYHVGGEFYHKCDIPLEWNAATGALTEMRSNNIGVMLLAKTGSICVFDSKVRLRFVG